MYKISIIVPVYNVERYLDKCVNSILNQTYKNIEVILVDDGSTDKSADMCDKFVLKDKRVKVIHKKNGGNASARKAGIDIATGDYLQFVDSDDWIEADMCETLLEKVKEYNADIVRCAMVLETKDGKLVSKDKFSEGVYKGKCDLRKIYKNFVFSSEEMTSGISGSLCPQIIRKELLINVYNKMDDSIQYGEDFAYAIIGILNADVIYISHDLFYHYRKREGSITQSSNYKYFQQINLLYLFLKEIFQEHLYAEMLLSQLDNLMDELVIRGLNEKFIISRDLRIPKYMFPVELLPFKSKIILYGAGAVGHSYYVQFNADRVHNIVAWVDKNYKKYQEQGMDVQSIEIVSKKEFDYILVAVKTKEVYEQIVKRLKKDYGISADKIIWEEPIHILKYYQR